MITKALSLHQPYAWAACKGIKWIENRSWRPNKGIVGTRIAIHATLKRPNAADIASVQHAIVRNELLACPSAEALIDKPRGGIVGSALVRGFVIPAANVVEVPGHASPAELLERVRKSPWFVGPVAWILEDAVAVKLIPAKGLQRIWNLDEEQREALNAVA